MYALASFPSLLSEENSIYITTFRDCYEAWVIYNFMSLCLAYVGGPGAVEVKMHGYVLMPSWVHWTCCLPPMPVNGRFIAMTKRGALQFVFLKPILAVLTVVLYATGNYTEGDWSASSSYLYLTIVYNITYTVALYALLLFYLGTHELLKPFNPLLKFVLVKSVIFMTYWQGLAIAILIGVGVIADSDSGTNIQNFLICIEMLPAAICMLYAFPHHPYKNSAFAAASRAGLGLGLSGGNVTHAMSISDVLSDTLHNFAPAYSEYVLYSDGTRKPTTTNGTAMPGSKKKKSSTKTDTAELLSSVEMGSAAAWPPPPDDGDGGNSNSNSNSNNMNSASDDSNELQPSPTADSEIDLSPHAQVMGNRYLTHDNDDDEDRHKEGGGANPFGRHNQALPATIAANPFQFEDVSLDFDSP